MYLIKTFWIYTTVSFFKSFSHLSVCVLKIFKILKKKKNVPKAAEPPPNIKPLGKQVLLNGFE